MASSDNIMSPEEVAALLAAQHQEPAKEEETPSIVQTATEQEPVDEDRANQDEITAGTMDSPGTEASVLSSHESAEPANGSPESDTQAKKAKGNGMLAGIVTALRKLWPLGRKSQSPAEFTEAVEETGREPAEPLESVKPEKLGSKKIVIASLFMLIPLVSLIVIFAVVPLLKGAFHDEHDDSAKTKLESMGIRFSTGEFVKYAGRGDKAVVELFLQGGMPPDSYRDGDGFTPLMAAAVFDRADVAAMLVKAGAKVNAKDRDEQTALMKAIFYDHPDMVDLLLQAKADLSSRDLHGNTVISLALEKKNPPILALLSQTGAAGLEQAMDKVRAKAQAPAAGTTTDGRTEAVVKPKIAPEFLLASHQAGYAQIGHSVESLYHGYDRSSVIFDKEYTDGIPYPVVCIRLPGQTNNSMLLSLNISKQGQQQTIDSIHVYDERFKTASGVGINSTLGDLRKGEGIGGVQQRGDSLYFVSADGKMLFEADITMQNLPVAWLQNGDIKALPDNIKIRSIIIQ